MVKNSKDHSTSTLTAEQLLQEATLSTTSYVSMGEKLHDMFKPNDLVTIKNIDSRPTGYVFVSPDDERVEIVDGDTTRRVYPGEADAVVLQAGETKVVPGWQAYVGLDRMWKAYAQHRSTADTSLIADEVARDKFLEESFVGLFDPNQALQAATTPRKRRAKSGDVPVEAPAPKPKDDLGFDQ